MSIRRFVTLASLLVLLVVPAAANAATITSAERLNRIQQRCTVLQTSIDQQQRRDLVARTDHGRAYENMIKQIDAFALRMRNNNLSTVALDTPASVFKQAVTGFREAYVRYDDNMNKLRTIDCHTRTTDFAQQLEQCRVLRAEVGVQVTKGETALQNYRKAMVALQATLPRSEAATGVPRE